MEQPVASSFLTPFSEFTQSSELVSPRDVNPTVFIAPFQNFETQDGSFSPESPSSYGQTVPGTTSSPSCDDANTFNTFSFPQPQQPQQEQEQNNDRLSSKKRKASAVEEEQNEDASGNFSKEQERLLKNRESAQQSRKRKKAYLSQLETDASDLSSKNEELKLRLSTLAAENQLLKDQLRDLRGVIAQATQFSMILAGQHPQQQQQPFYQPMLPQQQ